MFLNRFFFTKFYNLGGGWIYHNKSWDALNRYLYYNQQTIALFLLDKSINYLKKTFLILQNITIRQGSILFFSPQGYYFKDLKKKGFLLREFSSLDIIQGFFSNNLNVTKLLPDIVIMFDSSEYSSFLKELHSLGIPIIATLEKLITINHIEYPIFLNAFSYYIYFFILKLYGRLIFLCKNN